MDAVIKGMIVLSIVAFILAVVGEVLVNGRFMGVAPEGWSRGCTNLVLIAIALSLTGKGGAAQT